MRSLSGVRAAVRPTAARTWAMGIRGTLALHAALRRLNGVDLAQLHAKAAGAAWAIALFLVTPSVVASSLGSLLVWVMTGLVLVGALLSSTGLIVAARDPENDPVVLRSDLRRSLRGLGWELVGISLMLVGIALYFATQGVLSVALPEGHQRFALTFFAYFAGAQLAARLASVLHRRRKEARLASAIGGTT